MKLHATLAAPIALAWLIAFGVSAQSQPAQCTTVLSCAQAALQAAQAAEAAANRAAVALPVGTIIAFNGTPEEAQGQRQNGWWVANGRTVTDSASPYFGKNLPDLTNIFIRGGTKAGDPVGQDQQSIQGMTISSHTTGGFGPPNVGNADPRTQINGGLGWVSGGSSIYSEGFWPGATFSVIPRSYSVIYLIKVR